MREVALRTVHETRMEKIVKTDPVKEHQWLQRLVGEWTYEGSGDMGPDQPPCKMSGTESVRSVGGLWIVGNGTGVMPDGAAATMVLTLGFDPARGKFLGTWIGSMMTHMWVYEGSLDASGRVLTLDTTGPSMADPNKTARYQDIIEIKSDDVRTLTSRALGDDGTWRQFMQAEYRRKK